jgi:hypothetical protein
VGQQTDLALRLQRDLTWDRSAGSAFLVPGQGYRISYVDPKGIRWAENHNGWIGFRGWSQENFSLNVAFNRQKPYELQPAGVSYGPAGLVLAMAIMGITFVLRGMRRMQSPEPASETPTPESTEITPDAGS